MSRPTWRTWRRAWLQSWLGSRWRSWSGSWSGSRSGSWLLLMVCWASLLCLAACAHAPSMTPKGFSESRSTLNQLEASLKPQRWAVVIGVDQYEDPTFDDLHHAVKDARAMARVFMDPRAGGFDRVIALTSSERTTRDAILFELRRLLGDLRRQDTFVLYFSGHGTLEYSPDGQPLLYLVASDTRAGDFWGSGIDLRALRTFLDELKPQRKVLVLDSCFSGQGKSRVTAVTRARLDSSSPWPALTQSLSQSEAVLMASTLGGIAREDDQLGHGVYTHYLMRALTVERGVADTNHDGAVTVYEAHDYARARAVDHTAGAQVPDGFFRVLGRAEIFLAGTPDPALARAAALVYSYGAAGLRLEVDGRAKGTFPQTMVVEPGLRRVTVRDEKGEVIADGPLSLAAGQSWPVGLLLEEVRGYRRFFGVETGVSLPVAGAAVDVWGRVPPRIGLVSGYRVRGGRMRGLSLELGAGWSPALEGAWKELSEERVRHLVDLSARAVLRRSVGRLQVGGGWHGAVVYTPALTPATGLSLTIAQRQQLHGWLSLEGGPVLWEGIPLDKQILLTFEQRAAWFTGDFQRSWSAASNVQLAASVGLEVGF